MRVLFLITTLLSASVVLSACQRTSTNSTTSTSESSVTSEVVVETNDVDGADTSSATVSTSQTQSGTGSDSSSNSVVSTSGQESTVALTTKNYDFSVETIRVSSGTDLTLNITNEEGRHDFVIDALGVDSGVLPLGKEVELTIPTDKPGRYEYYCSVGDHRERGMVGTLIIE